VVNGGGVDAPGAGWLTEARGAMWVVVRAPVAVDGRETPCRTMIDLAW
jgi:hypothetical protein